MEPFALNSSFIIIFAENSKVSGYFGEVIIRHLPCTHLNL